MKAKRLKPNQERFILQHADELSPRELASQLRVPISEVRKLLEVEGQKRAPELLSARRMRLLLYLVLAVVPLIFTRASYLYWEIKYPAAAYLGVALLAILVFQVSRQGRVQLPGNAVNLPLLCLLVIGVASTLFAYNRLLAYNIGSQIFFLMIPYLAALYAVRSRREVEKLLSFSLGIASLVAAYGCLQYFGADEPIFSTWDAILSALGVEPVYYNRLGTHAVLSNYIPISTFGNRNWTAAYLAPQWVMGIYLLSRAERLRSRILYSGAILLLGFALVICRSRAAALSFLGALFVVFALTQFRSFRNSLLYMIGTFGVFVLIVLSFRPDTASVFRVVALTLAVAWPLASLLLLFRARISGKGTSKEWRQGLGVVAVLLIMIGFAVFLSERVQIRERHGSMKIPILDRYIASFDPTETTFEARLISWVNSSYIVKDELGRAPFLGVGPGNYRVLYPLYLDAFRRDPDIDAVQRLRPHNETLQVAVELGPLGLAVWVWFLLAVLWMARSRLRLKGRNRTLAAALTVGILHTMFETNFEFVLENPGASVFFWLSLGCLAQLPFEKDEKKETKENRLFKARGIHRKLTPAAAWGLRFSWLVVAAFVVLPLYRPVSATAQFLGEYNKRSGFYFQESGDLFGCRERWDRARSWAPGDYYNWFNYGYILQAIGTAYMESGDSATGHRYFQEAIDPLKHCLDLHPNFFEALNNLGRCYTETNQFTDAQAYYERALRIDPEYELATYNLGTMFLKKGIVLGQASEIETDPKRSRLLKEQSRGSYLKAIDYLEEAIRLNIAMVQAKYNLANALHNVGVLEQNLGNQEAGIRYLTRAATYFEKITRFRRYYQNALLYLAINYEARGLPARAVGPYKEHLAVFPGDIQTHIRLAECLEQVGSLDEAVERIEALLRDRRRNSDDPANLPMVINLLYTLAGIEERRDNREAAVSHMRELLQMLDPTDAEGISAVRARIESLSAGGFSASSGDF